MSSLQRRKNSNSQDYRRFSFLKSTFNFLVNHVFFPEKKFPFLGKVYAVTACGRVAAIPRDPSSCSYKFPRCKHAAAQQFANSNCFNPCYSQLLLSLPRCCEQILPRLSLLLKTVFSLNPVRHSMSMLVLKTLLVIYTTILIHILTVFPCCCIHMKTKIRQPTCGLKTYIRRQSSRII